MIQYKFSYRKWILWHTVLVTGHTYDAKLDRMNLHLPTGGGFELANWRQYDVRLGPDWALAVKKSMEEKAGIPIPVKALG